MVVKDICQPTSFNRICSWMLLVTLVEKLLKPWIELVCDGRRHMFFSRTLHLPPRLCWTKIRWLDDDQTKLGGLSNSLNLNPLDYFMCSMVKWKTNQYSCNTIDSLKSTITSTISIQTMWCRRVNDSCPSLKLALWLKVVILNKHVMQLLLHQCTKFCINKFSCF